MKRRVVVGVAAALALSLAGCASGPASSAAVDTRIQEALDQATPSPGPVTTTFGQSVTWPSGLSVTVSAPQSYSPSATATSQGAGRYIWVTVTLHNGSSNGVNPNMLVLGASADGVEAERVFDSERKVLGPPGTTVLPGKSAGFKAAYALVSKESVELQVDAKIVTDFTAPAAIFVGRV